MTSARDELAAISTFPQLVRYLRDDLDWPVSTDDFEDLVFDYAAEDLGIDARNAAKIQEIKRLRPLSAHQPWGIFFVKFEPKRLPVVALRRILSGVTLKKRASVTSPDHAAWAASDLLFISNYGEDDARHISFAHFSQGSDGDGLPSLRVLGWDNLDTPLHFDAVALELATNLRWPEDEADLSAWRARWATAFTLRNREVITTSREMAIRLAQLAKAIRNRIMSALAIETDRGPLTQLMKAVRVSLVHDLDARGFADMYAQTIAYGLLSARIADPEAKTAGALAAHMRTNPLLRDLLETFLHIGGQRGVPGGPGIDFDELGVAEVVEVLSHRNIEAVVRDFGDRNPDDDPVIHFYELFLKEYDERQRMQRGVFYTPRPVVSYIVRAVDEVLRSDFGLEDGLADTATWGDVVARLPHIALPAGVKSSQPFLRVLDPATGTGTFLVEVIDIVYRTLRAKWRGLGHTEGEIRRLWNEYVPDHLLPRLTGYELLMAPYAIAHLKIGLKLHETGYEFVAEQRARVFLTNALEPAEDFSARFDFAVPALAREAREVNEVKLREVFTVVIGNPPYSNRGQLNRVPFILALLQDYKRGLEEKKLNLDDDFIKFIRLGQYVIDRSGCGVIGMITNNTYLDAPTRRGMRSELVKAFSDISILDLHGNSIEREKAPDGSADENVFDIQQGVAISLLSKWAPARLANVRRSDLRGLRAGKYATLGREALGDREWAQLPLRAPLFRFEEEDASTDEYNAFVPLLSVLPVSGSGVKTDRDPLCFDLDPKRLEERMRAAFSGKYSSDFAETYGIHDSSSYDLTRRLSNLRYDPGAIRPCLYRPFDTRSLYYQVGFTSRPAWQVMRHMVNPNLGLLAKRQARDGAYDWFLVSDGLVVDGLFSIDNKGREQIFPLYLYPDESRRGLGLVGGERSPAFGASFLARLSGVLGLPPGPDGLPLDVSAEEIFGYVYAVFHSPTYRSRYEGPLKQDYPRLPLPRSLGLFRQLAIVGAHLVELHLLRTHDEPQGKPSFVGTVGAVVSQLEYNNGTVWLEPARVNGFAEIAEQTWRFRIGGHQVCEKWLKDRKGRPLAASDIAHYARIVGAIAATIDSMVEIDEIIDQHGGWPAAFVARTDDERRSPSH